MLTMREIESDESPSGQKASPPGEPNARWDDVELFLQGHDMSDTFKSALPKKRKRRQSHKGDEK
jgi:hypothetical protein